MTYPQLVTMAASVSRCDPQPRDAVGDGCCCHRCCQPCRSTRIVQNGPVGRATGHTAPSGDGSRIPPSTWSEVEVRAATRVSKPGATLMPPQDAILMARGRVAFEAGPSGGLQFEDQHPNLAGPSFRRDRRGTIVNDETNLKDFCHIRSVLPPLGGRSGCLSSLGYEPNDVRLGRLRRLGASR